MIHFLCFHDALIRTLNETDSTIGLNPLMAKGEGWMPSPNRFFPVFLGMGRVFIPNKIFNCDLIRVFLNRTYRLGPKIR